MPEPRKKITRASWKDWSFPGGKRWQDWRPLSAQLLKKAPDGTGSYAVSLPRKRPGKGMGIGRLLGNDIHGVLHIGEAHSLRDRLRDFSKCVGTKDVRGHMAGWRLGSMGLLERLAVHPSDLRVTWCEATSKEEAYLLESTMLRDYFDLFGELPPLNYKSNWAAYMPE